jgi:WD repeat-containing protein 59
VQWSPFPQRDYWVVSTSNQKALVWNLNHYSAHTPFELILHAHSRAITDINFSAHDPNLLATCAVDSFVHCWDLRHSPKPALTFADWNAGATQVKWNRQDQNIIASSHDKFLKIWDKRKGAYPLKTIEAHSTKIYGIDWNRTRVSGIVTCSLDRTIKLWDYKKATNEGTNEPEKVIQTNFPVWRARYTPFGWGLLAMPQRGDFNLHLYDRRPSEGVECDGHIEPVHSFRGHEGHVREFLWRFRGNIDEGRDNRDFQLISWGADKDLRLHRMDPKWELRVGHEKGAEVRKELLLSRLGASYHTFRDESRLPGDESLGRVGNRPLKHQLGGLSKVFSSSAINSGLLPSSLTTYARGRKKKPENPMKWIEGVRIGNRSIRDESPVHREVGRHGETPETLSEEMTYVWERFKKVDFEKADVHGRSAKVALSGPWGPEGKSVLLRLNFEFPVAYPHEATPEITFERTHSGVPDDVIRKLQGEVFSIIEHYRTRRRGCLEAVITYLLGEKNMEESLILKPHDGLEVPLGTPADEDTSDEEEEVAPMDAEDLETSGTVLPPQDNVPLGRTSGALWAADGQLICFFPPKAEPAPVFTLDTIRNAEKSRNLPRQFETFGRLKEKPLTNSEKHHDSDDEHDTSSATSWSGTSSSSSSDEDNVSQLPARFKPPKAWRTAVLRNQKPSSHSSSGPTAKKTDASKAKAIISIHDLSNILPSKKTLAREYRIFGDGPSVCDHNADVATRLGLHSLASVWELCKQILFDEVPLEKLDSKRKNESILVLAKRNAVRIRRKDSGLDLMFDEPEAVVHPRLTGRVKWGKHPFANSWMIPALFEYYEQAADVQMLGMLACIFSEPAAQGGILNALQTMEPEDLPISVKAPAFSLSYFPSRDSAISTYERRSISRLPTPSISTSHYVDYFSRQAGNSGSLGSSNGPFGEFFPSEPPTPYSTGNTPPLPLSRQNTVASSLSTSPDPAISRVTRRSNSTISNAFASISRASISRPFSINVSSSPPVTDRNKNEADLSTSAPTATVTWGINTSFTGSSPNSPVHRRKSNARSASFATYDSTYNSSDEDYDTMSDEDEEAIMISHSLHVSSPKVNIALKNQRMFDDEGYANIPLLAHPTSTKWTTYRAIYANLLGQWRLHIAQAEVLKFNGLTPSQPLPTPPLEGLPYQSTVSFEIPRPSASFLKPLMTLSAQNSASQSPQNASSTSPPSKPLDPTATPFVPQPNIQSGTSILRTPTNASSQSDVHGILTIPRSGTPPLGQEKFDFSFRRDSANVQPSLLQRATSRARLGGEGKQSKRQGSNSVGRGQERTCVVCWEYVHGLHILCREGKHRAHMECLLSGEEQSDEWRDELLMNGIGCSCEVTDPGYRAVR